MGPGSTSTGGTSRQLDKPALAAVRASVAQALPGIGSPELRSHPQSGHSDHEDDAFHDRRICRSSFEIYAFSTAVRVCDRGFGVRSATWPLFRRRISTTPTGVSWRPSRRTLG